LHKTGVYDQLDDVYVGIGESDGQQIVSPAGLDFPRGTNTLTTTLYAYPTATSVTVPIHAATTDGNSGGCYCYPTNDPGVTTSVQVRPVTMTASVSPSVVSPTGSNPLLTVIAKNANGTLIPACQPNQSNCITVLPNTASDCAVFDHEYWDSSNPNVTQQMVLGVLQPEVTEVCNIQLTYFSWAGTLTANTSVTYQANLSSADLGPSCPRAGAENVCGSPINLTNGNTWVAAADYALPGLGGGISLIRTWNSQWSIYSPWIQAGMFGDSWQSNFEKNMQVLSGGKQLRYWRGDGSAWFFTQSQNTWTLASPADERATLTYSSKNGYTLTLRDGAVELYNSNGFLTALQDRNGNKTTLTYDGTSYNRVSKVTDAAGRVLQFNYGNSLLPKQVTSIQDSAGIVATYAYDSGSHLLSVTYADDSVLNYSSDANGLILAVIDSQGKILESHTYDSLLCAAEPPQVGQMA
jgi:YD repeat-containing protein